jgi:hypothetical protein
VWLDFVFGGAGKLDPVVFEAITISPTLLARADGVIE